MHIAIYTFAIGVFVLVAIITSRLTQKFNARNPQLEWVLAAWAVNIISYLFITEFLHFSIITAGVVYLILSTFTYIYFIGVRWKPIALLNVPSAIALLAFLALFGLLPSQSEVRQVNKITKEICKCNNMLCIRITSGLLPRDFATNEKWAKQSKALKQCTQYLEGSQAISTNTSPDQFFFAPPLKIILLQDQMLLLKKH